MAKFRVKRDVPGYKKDQLVDVLPANVGIWQDRPWAERVKGSKRRKRQEAPENASAEPDAESAAKRKSPRKSTGKHGKKSRSKKS